MDTDVSGIQIKTNEPSLAKKLEIKVEKGSKDIYWYIRFNNKLEKESVTKDSMAVTDFKGYIMRTYVYYDETRNYIIISPIDSYRENMFYILSIEKSVRSKNGKLLKAPIHILFKLLGNKISGMKVLKDNIIIPEHQNRPENYEELVETHIRNGNIFNDIELDKNDYSADKDNTLKLKQKSLKINFLGALVGSIPIFIIPFINNLAFVILAFNIAVFGFGHLIYQITKKKFRSTISYNKGVTNFNNEEYDMAYINFKKAHKLDDDNTFALDAIKETKKYI